MLLRESLFEPAAELFYEAVAVPELWPKALQVASDAFHAAGAALYPVGPGPNSAIASSGFTDFIGALVAEGWMASNPRMKRGLRLTRAGWKGLITDRDMFGPDGPPDDRFNSDFLRKHGLYRCCTAGMVLARSDPDLVLPISFERRHQDGPYTHAEIARMNRLVEQLKQAATLAVKVGLSAAQDVAASLAHIGKDVALIGASGRLVGDSSSLIRHCGDAIEIRRGVVSSWEAEANRQLAAGIQRAIGRRPVGDRIVSPIALPRKSGRRPLVVHLLPIAGKGQDVFMLARALLILTDPDDTRAGAVETIATALGLTPAEARLARRIAAGEDLRHIAEAESITLETARSRLKTVFHKTGTHRQAELAILIATLSR